MNIEDKHLQDGMARVKFQTTWIQTLEEFLADHPKDTKTLRIIQDELAEAMLELEAAGATPIAPDGKVGGNAAALVSIGNETYLLVSKSGKLAHKKMDIDKDFCIIKYFNVDNWSAEYYACDNTVLPTSDTPLHHYGLQYCTKFDWAKHPKVVLHGHALETEEQANKLGFPISIEETLFSTKEDSNALVDLMDENPYPEDKIFIRKGHGFLVFSDTVREAVDLFRDKMKPHISLQ